MAFDNLITATPAWAQCVTPRDGNKLNEANFLDMQQRSANRDAFLRRMVAPQYIYVSVIGGSHDMKGDGGTVWWEPDPGAGTMRQWGTADGLGVFPQLQIDLGQIPHQAVVNEIRVTINGTGTYTGTPATKVSAKLMRKEGGTAAAATALYSPSDPNSHPNMTTLRDIIFNTGSLTLDRSTYSYFLLITGESGANSVRGVRIYSVRVTLQQPAAL